jgi:CRISPR-associated protein Cmr3
MTPVKQWLLLDPLDTLFFKGSEPMVAGENHEVRTIFPPMPETIMGSLITVILHQRQINPRDFTRQGGPVTDITTKYNLLGSPGEPLFNTFGPLFRIEINERSEDWFFPAPAHWFGDISSRCAPGQEVEIRVTDTLTKYGKSLPPGLCGSVHDPVWLLNPPNSKLKSLAGYWVNLSALKEIKEQLRLLTFFPSLEGIKPGKPTIIPLKALFDNEFRVGIALEPLTRKVRSGHLYASTQARLQRGVKMVLGLSEKLCPDYLDSQGILQLGGEQRLVRYELLSATEICLQGKSPWLMALAPFKYAFLEENGWESWPRVSGPLIRLAGWDMKKNFHKAITAYLPAGTVIRAGEVVPVPYGFIRL